jgi:hypothetical protein
VLTGALVEPAATRFSINRANAISPAPGCLARTAVSVTNQRADRLVGLRVAG